MSLAPPPRFAQAIPHADKLEPILSSLTDVELQYLIQRYSTFLYDNHSKVETYNEAKKCVALCKEEKERRKNTRVTYIHIYLLFTHI